MVTNPLRINLTKNSKLEGNGMIVFWKGYYCKKLPSYTNKSTDSKSPINMSRTFSTKI